MKILKYMKKLEIEVGKTKQKAPIYVRLAF